MFGGKCFLPKCKIGGNVIYKGVTNIYVLPKLGKWREILFTKTYGTL